MPKPKKQQKKVKAWVILRDDGSIKSRIMVDQVLAIFPRRVDALRAAEGKIIPCVITYEI